MLKSRTGYDQSVQTTTCAICGRYPVFTILKNVSVARVAVSTSKYGRSSVAAGVVPMPHESSLFVVDGPAAAPPTPNVKVAFGAAVKLRPANAEPATRRVATKASVVSFFIDFLLPISNGNTRVSAVALLILLDDTITSREVVCKGHRNLNCA